MPERERALTIHRLKADDSNANLVEPKGSALYGGEWREQGEDAGAEEVVLLHEVNGLAAEKEEKHSGTYCCSAFKPSILK